jgi:hypothetical protein
MKRSERNKLKYLMIIEQIKFRQILYITGLILIILGLFLPWYTSGDLISVDKQPLVLKWSIVFSQAGGRYYLPSIEQNIPYGFFALIGAICLIVLRAGKIFSHVAKWITLGIALLLLSLSVYYHITIWRLSMIGGIIGLSSPRLGLYLFLSGSLILFLICLQSVGLKKERP